MAIFYLIEFSPLNCSKDALIMFQLLFDKFVKDNSSQQESYRKLQNEMAVQEANYTRLASDLQFKNSELRVRKTAFFTILLGFYLI